MQARVRNSRARARLIAGALLALAPAALALSGCGGGGPTPATAAGTAHPAPAAAQAQTPYSRAAALSFAHAVNLLPGDIPEASVWTIRHKHGADPEREHEWAACVGPAGHAQLTMLSPLLKRGSELEVEGFLSEVAVTRTPAALAAAVGVLQRPSVRTCMAHVMTRWLDSDKLRNAHWGTVTASALPVPLQGSETVGVRLTIPLDIPFDEVSVPLYADFLAFAHGRALVTIVTLSVTQPVPANTERELVELLHRRAEAHQV